MDAYVCACGYMCVNEQLELLELGNTVETP